MKKFIFLSMFALVAVAIKGQNKNPITYTTTIGTGIPMSEPSSTPFSWQISVHHKLTERFAIGAGTGLLVYEEALIPAFVDAKFLLTAPRKFVPYLLCGAGYAFAPTKEANGGFLLNPSIGVQYAIHGNIKLLLGLGYEMQKLERLKKYKNDYYIAEFKEKLTHNTLSVRFGILF